MSERAPDLSASPAAPTRGSFLVGLVRDWGIAIAVVLVLVAGYNFFFEAQAPPLGPAPEFSLTNLDGEEVSLSTIGAPGDLVVLNFWFTSCPPCRAEIPELTRFHAAHPEIPLVGVSTDVGMPLGRLKVEAARLGIGYPVLHDARAEVARAYGVRVFPTTLVLREGAVVQARIGAVNQSGLEALLAGARAP